MLKSILSKYSDTYILEKRTITGARADVVVQRADKRNKQVRFKSSGPFTNCISKIYNIQVDNVTDLNIGMPMYNLIEYRNNYAETEKL